MIQPAVKFRQNVSGVIEEITERSWNVECLELEGLHEDKVLNTKKGSGWGRKVEACQRTWHRHKTLNHRDS